MATATTITCGAPYGAGGLGRHLAQVVEEAREAGRLGRYFATGLKSADDEAGRAVAPSSIVRLAGFTPLRFNGALLKHLTADRFDRAVASQIGPCQTIAGFAGYALRTMRQGRRLGVRRVELQSPTAHIAHTARQHARALRQFPIEGDWLHPLHRRKTLREYDEADVIYVASEYSRQTFLDAGVPAGKVERIPLTLPARFRPPERWIDDGVFRVVYVGGLTVVKGVPLLIEAFSRLALPRAELTLVGGWSTRGMARYIRAAMARDPRIRVTPGDPLPHLQRASVYVHPSFQDGWGYAPAEAMACGVPVIVTDQTGMKEAVHEGVNGYVIAAGDGAALSDRLLALARAPLTMQRADSISMGLA